MKKLLSALCLALALSAVAPPADARPGLCRSIERCFGSNACLDALIDEELMDAALLYYGENCMDGTILV
jgi:hypothetical protein